MTLGVEDAIDGCVDREESLGRALALETLHFALAPADREMRILSPVVLAHPSRMVPLAHVEVMRGGTVGSQPIGHDTLGMDSDILQQLAHQPERRPLVSALLEQHIENLAFIIHCTPEIHPCPANADHHLVQMPARRWVRPRDAKRLCNANAKFERPATDSFVTDVDTAFSQQILDIAKTHRETEIEPHRMSNHTTRKSVTSVRDWFHRVRATPPSYRRRGETSKATVNLTTPGDHISRKSVAVVRDRFH